VNGNGNGKKSKRRKRIIYGSIAAVVLLVIAGGVYAATSGGTKIDPSKLAKVEKGDLAKSVVATGKIEPITKVEIKSKASGIVKKLYVSTAIRSRKASSSLSSTRKRFTPGWTRRARSSKRRLPA